MASLAVRYLDVASNSVKEELVQADQLSALRDRLERAGHLFLGAHEASAARWLPNSTKAGARKPAEVALLCRELRSLLQAGLSVVEALDALSHATDARGVDSVHAAILARLQEGKSLSAALREVGGFPALLIASVQSSERTSNLDEALESYLHYDDLMLALRRKVVSAALYPSIVVGLGLAVSAFLLLVVVPRFSALYGEMAVSGGSSTRWLIELSVWLSQHRWIAAAGVCLLVAAVVASVRTGMWRVLWDGLLESVPLLREQVDQYEKARVFEALAMLVRGGYSLHEALLLSEGVVSGRRGMARLRMAREAIERGEAVAAALSSAGLTDAITQRLLRAADRGGEFHRVLKAVAQRHARSFETFIERATRVIEPALLLMVAIIVGGLVVLLYMPIFDIASSVR